MRVLAVADGVILQAMSTHGLVVADPAPGPTGFVPQLLTAILGLVAATLAARRVLRTRRLQDQSRPPPDPDPTTTRRR
jgi:hypothetical protein